MILAAVAALLGATVQSATGFGFALILSPALFAVLEPVEAVTTLLLLGLVLNLLVLFEHGRPEHVDLRRLTPMLAAALPGLAAGAALLVVLSKSVLQVGVGLAVIAAAIWQLRHRGGPGRPQVGRAVGWAVGFLSGALTTSISVSGPPIVLWLESHGVRPVEFRASLAVSFFALNVAGTIVLIAVEEGAALDVDVLGPLVVLVLVGHVLGGLAFRRLAPERFFVAALALVIVTGLASLLAGLGVI
jgi:uncharacterized membrane protein YfcA